MVFQCCFQCYSWTLGDCEIWCVSIMSIWYSNIPSSCSLPSFHRWLPRTNSTTTKLKLAFCWRYLSHILMARDRDRRPGSVPVLSQPSRIKLQQHCVPLLWGFLLQWCPVEWRGLQPVQCVGELSMREVCGDVTMLACLTTFVFSHFRQQRFSVVPPPSLRFFRQTLSLRQQKSLRQFSQMQPLLIQWYNNVYIHDNNNSHKSNNKHLKKCIHSFITCFMYIRYL